MPRRCEIVDVPPGRGFPYEVGDTPMLADHVADDWVDEGTARELEDTTDQPEPAMREMEDATAPPEPEAAVVEEERGPEPAPPTYRKRTRSPGWYDVVGPDGEAVNDKALREDDADELIAELEE